MVTDFAAYQAYNSLDQLPALFGDVLPAATVAGGAQRGRVSHRIAGHVDAHEIHRERREAHADHTIAEAALAEQSQRPVDALVDGPITLWT